MGVFKKRPFASPVTQSGFTLVEILIICPIMMAVITFMMSYLFRQFGELTKQNVTVNLQVEAQADIFSIQDDVFFANAFVSTLNTNLTDSYAPTGGWSTSSSPTVFIVSTPASTASHRVSTRQPVYINTLGCTPQSVKEQNDALFDNVIIFVSGTNLYKRIVSAPSGTSTCGTDYRRQTCPSNHVTATCPKDILLTSHLNSFTVGYSDANGNAVTTPEQASIVKLALKLGDVGFGEPVTASSNITLRRVNQ